MICGFMSGLPSFVIAIINPSLSVTDCAFFTLKKLYGKYNRNHRRYVNIDYNVWISNGIPNYIVRWHYLSIRKHEKVAPMKFGKG